ncbi:unnamed protein product [Candidula unifasciata]|uniref:C2H2-type domain-containing protein n=1 Tax=Candidula unifasciata TaxID=100452 RepID=A0A8S3Z986_9EUPU|nr:unnamed protein product [Candidula unifasciata]
MAANLGQAFLGAAGMVPTLVQELAAGNFHENRETFHDYIYSKLILGDDKSNVPGISSPNPPVFPNTNLASSYPNQLPITNTLYGPGSSDNNRNSIDSSGGGSNVSGGKAFNSSLTKNPSSQKSGSLKKKPSQSLQNLTRVGATPTSEDLMKEVKKSHHKKKEKTNVCDVCGRGFAEKYTLNRHMLTHTHVRPYSCTKCNMSFSRSDGLAKHMTTPHRRIDAHHCDVCSGTFNSEVSFEQHRREYGNTLPFVCNLCMLAFSQCCHLNYHMKTHALSKMNDSLAHEDLDDKNNAIDVSELIPEDFSPTKKESAKSPVGRHFLSPPKMTIGHADRKNDNSLGVLDPSIVVKPEVEEYIACQAGNQTSRNSTDQSLNLVHSSFNSPNNFSSMASSSNTSQEGKYSQASQPGNHLTPSNAVSATEYLPETISRLNSTSPGEAVSISDTDMKKYMDIKIPNPRFHDSSLLQGSSLSEDGLFRCEICGKGFTRKYHMQRHVKLHIRGPVPKAHLLDWTRRPYACGVCKMGFTRQHHLTRHMLIHTGERPHSCHECGKAFRRFTNLTLHVRTVHGSERPFKCHICGRGFPRLYSLQRHLKLHAKSSPDLAPDSADLLYEGFKHVGEVHYKDGKFPYPVDLNNTQRSPSQESISSEHTDDSDRFDPESSGHEDSMDPIDPGRSSSPVTNRYTLLRNDSGEAGFHSDGGRRGLSKDQDVGSDSKQTDDWVGLQVKLSPDSNGQFQNKVSKSDMGNALRQNSVPASDELNPLAGPDSEPLRRQGQLPAKPVCDYNRQSSLHSSIGERFVPVKTMLTPNVRTRDFSGGGNFNDLAIRGTSSFSLSQRSDDDDDFSLRQQRIQSPHPSLNIERPGGQSTVNQAGGSDTVIHTQSGYIHSPTALLPQRAGMDLTDSQNIEMQEPGVYSHSLHNIDMGSGRSGIKEPNMYSIGHMQLPRIIGGMYQQQLTGGLNHSEVRPDPSTSPRADSSRGNNMQY